MQSVMRTLFAMALILSACGMGTPATAQTPEELVKSLQVRKPVTRGLAPSGPSAQDQRTRSLVNSLRGKATRQITVEERAELAKVAKEANLPSVDLEINFEYDSAAITKDALPKLVALGQALSSEQLKGATFLIGGHTDATGSAQYNQGLSERRAEAVKHFLVSTYRIDPRQLIAIGYGEEQLKNPAAPASGENRRVQIVNLAQ